MQKNPPRMHRLCAAIALTMGGLIYVSAPQAAAVVQLSSLDGSNGFRLDGAGNFEMSGRAVSAAGDINGDGIDDVVIGAVGANPNGTYSGSSFIVFGRSTSRFDRALTLHSLDGSNGFRLDGTSVGDRSGKAISAAGDINGDGLGDLIIGAYEADFSADGSGSSYVVFGQSTGDFSPAINLSTLDGTTGFRLDGASAFDSSGLSVSAAGDINGDGIDDVIIGARHARPNGNSSGSSYVVFGRRAAGFASEINLSTLDGNSGFRLDGADTYDYSGRAVSAAGDINGDGVNDLIIGAPGVDSNGSDSGSSYVVFGRSTSGFPSVIELSTLNGRTGFRLDGANRSDRSGTNVSAAGDINGDGISDLIIGAASADPNGSYSGSSYVVFGRSSGEFASAINLSTLDGSTGFRLDGVNPNQYSGFPVSDAGDVNGDGIDDLIIGAHGADYNGHSSGSSYVVFGRSTGSFAAVVNLSTINDDEGFRIDGVSEGDKSGYAVSAAGDINGDGIDDLAIGAFGADPDGIDSGSSYVLFGTSRFFRNGFEDGG